VTNVTVDLSTALQGTLGHAGVYAYAVYFTPNPVAGQPDIAHFTPTPLVNDGAVAASTTIAMPADYESGKIYFLIQSVPSGTSTLVADITSQGQAYINWANAAADHFRFDSFELNLQNKSTDVGNLTSVNGFGIGMSVTVGTDTRGYDIKASDVFHDVIAVSDNQPASQDFTYGVGALAADQRMVLSGAEGVAQKAAFLTTDWAAYLLSLEGKQAANDIQIAGWFNGAPDDKHIWHNAGFYSYTLDWQADPSAPGGQGYFWLDPTIDPLVNDKHHTNSEIQGHIRISTADLANSIYSTLGNVDIFENKSDVTPYLTMNAGANNQWGEVLTQFLTGFTGGYYGGTGNSLNPLIHETIDLNKTWNWDPTYAFGNNGTPSSLPTPPSGGSAHYDAYAKIFFDHSNSYGAGYSDNLMKAYSAGGPLMSLWDSATGADAATIAIKLFDDTEVPGGYVQPQMYNYLQAPYVTPAQFEPGDGLNIGVSLSNATVQLRDGTPVTFGWYDTTKQAFTTVSVPSGQTLFQNWNITAGPDNTWSLQSTGPNVTGNILFNALPVSADPKTAGDSVSWYQLTIDAGGAHEKIFNLYITTHSDGLDNPNSVQFVNPAYPGQEAAIQIDGLGSVTGPNTVDQYIGTFPINLMDGSGYGLDASLLTQITNQSVITDPTNGTYPTPFVPLLGNFVTDPATQQTHWKQAYSPYEPPAATQTDPHPAYTPPSQTVGLGAIAFGWDGADSTYVSQQVAAANYFVEGYTNKIGAYNIARLSFTGPNAPSAVSVAADIDGNWISPLIPGFSNGTTYTVTMDEYDPKDTRFQHPLAKTSYAQTFTVALSDLPLSADGSDALQLSGDGSTAGNWVRLQTTHSTVPNGTVIVYTTDAAGNLVGRNGEIGPGVTFEDAIRAHIGSVTDDHGNVLMSGGQSIYLSADQRLHFAIEGSDSGVERTPGVNISGAGALEIDVNGNLGSIHLTAVVNNTLTATEALALGQQMTDRPMVNLNQGQTVHLEIAGSASDTSTIHFVHIDVDPTTNAWSVGGVAYGNTDEFRMAVQTNWDQNLSVQNGGGTFHGAVDWTVAGASGFFSPVLQTQSGDILVVGTANVDGHEHIRAYGENIYAFEDRLASQGSDFDYNDYIVKMTVA